MIPRGRAHTEAHKKAIMAGLLAYWLEVPDLRLGQLLSGALDDDDMFYIEDYQVLLSIDSWVGKNAR